MESGEKPLVTSFRTWWALQLQKEIFTEELVDQGNDKIANIQFNLLSKSNDMMNFRAKFSKSLGEI